MPTAVLGPATAATRDTTLDVRVLGSGFDAGSRADFLLGGAAVPGVITNRTTYRGSRELLANVRAISINRVGQVVGNAARPDGQLAPFVWID